MKNFKASRLVIIVILVLIFFSGCSDKKTNNNLTDNINSTALDAIILQEETTEITTTENKIEDTAINPLTGLLINEQASKRRPIGVMINNLKPALPQSGISQADVVYETLVEGAITRLFAVFQDFDSEKIGPIRSARHYFLDFAFDFDALYVHYGLSPQAYTAIKKYNAPSLNGLSALDSVMCYQDKNRVRPHSTYTSFEGLMAGIDYKGYNIMADSDFHNPLYFSETEYTPLEGTEASVVRLDYSGYSKPWFEFRDGYYFRYQFNQPHIDEQTQEQLSYKNIIIELVDIYNIPGDNSGRLDMSLISKGNGYYITNERAIPIYWKKQSHYQPTVYYLESGEKLLINKGKTWISIFPSYRADKIVFEK